MFIMRLPDDNYVSITRLPLGRDQQTAFVHEIKYDGEFIDVVVAATVILFSFIYINQLDAVDIHRQKGRKQKYCRNKRRNANKSGDNLSDNNNSNSNNNASLFNVNLIFQLCFINGCRQTGCARPSPCPPPISNFHLVFVLFCNRGERRCWSLELGTRGQFCTTFVPINRENTKVSRSFILCN